MLMVSKILLHLLWQHELASVLGILGYLFQSKHAQLIVYW